MVPTEWQVRAVLGDCISKARVISIRAPQYRQCALISDFLDLANLRIREEAALATNWIKDRLEVLKLQNVALATMTGPAVRCQPKNITADVQHAINKCDSLGAGKQLIRHGNLSAIAIVFPHMAVLRRHLLPNMHFQCCMSLERHPQWKDGHLCCQRWIYCLGTPLETPFKTNWREGLSVSQSNFSVPHLIRVWTIVMFWKEDSGMPAPADYTWKRRSRWDQLSISANFTFFDDSDVHFGPCGPLAPPGPHEPPGSPGLPLGWPLAPSPAGEREREPEIHRVSGCIRDLDHPSLNLFQFQWVMATMISHQNKRDNGNGPDRVIEYILTHKCHRYHKCNLWLLQNLTMHQMKTWQLWIPHHHQLDHHHQLNREVAPEETKDPDRVSEYLHIHLRMPDGRHTLLYLFPEFSRPRLWQLRAQTKIQQPWIHKIAWATVQGHHKNEKAHEDRVHKTDGKENCCTKSAEWITEGQKAQLHGIRWRRWRTSKRAGNLFNLSTYCSSTSLLSKTRCKYSRTSCPW